MELFLQLLIAVAARVRFLMPYAISFSMSYLQSQYKVVLREKDLHLRKTELQRLWALRRRIHPPQECYMVKAKIDFDIPLMVNLCELADGDIYYGIGFEQNESAIVKRFLGNGETFFDVGANIGVYTLLSSHLVGNTGQVHAFEPLTRIHDILRRNVELNHAVNVVLNPVAIGENMGEENLFVNMQSGLTSLGRTNRGKVVGVQKVPIWTLDDYAERAGINSIDFLKIDVEGYEGHVLRGGTKLLSNSPDLIVLSELAKKNFEPLGFSVSEVLNWMRDRGYEIWMVASDALELHPIPLNLEIYPFQNFLFIRRENKKYHLLKDYVKLS